MRTESRTTFYLTRPELERAVARYCGIPEDHEIDNMWIKSEHLAEPEPVVGIAYIHKDSSTS